MELGFYATNWKVRQGLLRDENDLKIIGVETTVLKKGRSKTFKL